MHWRKEMHGWGRVNSQGDWETIVTWCTDKKPNDGRDCHLVTMKRAAVDAVANSLGGQVITVFDVIRMKTRPSPDIGDENTTKEKITQTGTQTIYRSSKGATATYIRGVQILCQNVNLRWDIHGEDDEELDIPIVYKIYDWRHETVRDVSYQRGEVTNYFLITTQAKRNLSSRSGIGGVLSAT